MKIKDFILDGINNGIVATNDQGEILSFGKWQYKQELFKSVSLLKAKIEKEKIVNYTIGVVINYKQKDQEVIPEYKLLKPNPDYYEYMDFINDQVYDIYLDVPKEKILAAGYFTFTDSPTEKIMDVEEGIKISKMCYGELLKAVALEQRRGSISKSEIDHINSSVFLLKRRVYESTVSLRLMRRFELVKINEYRKSIQIRSFPYNNNMDKYKTVYFVYTIDSNEIIPNNVSYGIMYNSLKNIKENLVESCSDLNPDYTIISTKQIDI